MSDSHPTFAGLSEAAKDPRGHAVPRAAAGFGMWLFLAALFMLFAASLLAFALLVLTARRQGAAVDIDIPVALWVSTALMLACSFMIHRALHHVRRERQVRFRNALVGTAVLSLLFVVVQTPSLTALMGQHREALRQHEQARVEAGRRGAAAAAAGREAAALRAADAAAMQAPGDTFAPRSFVGLFGIVFVLILVHALHVVGGLVALAIITVRANAHAYDHEHFAPVRNLALYWHFLDGVWIVLFAAFLIAL